MLETKENTMAEICRNCAHEIVFNFCGNCGQKKVKRIDRNYIKDEIQYTVLHMNKGFLYSIKKILRAPGTTAREFVEGNRVNHYKPLLLVFVVAGISAFLTNILLNPQELLIKQYESQGMSTSVATAASSFIFKYSAFIMLLLVPFAAFFTWISFKKWGYNYYENVVITAYSLVCFQVITIILVLPVQYFLKDNVALFFKIPSILSLLVLIVVFLWFYIDFYSTKPLSQVLLKSLLFVFLFCLSFMVLMVILGIGIGIYSIMNGIDPSSLK